MATRAKTKLLVQEVGLLPSDQREGSASYVAAWNDLDLKRDLRKRRDQMLSDPYEIFLDVIRVET